MVSSKEGASPDSMKVEAIKQAEPAYATPKNWIRFCAPSSTMQRSWRVTDFELDSRLNSYADRLKFPADSECFSFPFRARVTGVLP